MIENEHKPKIRNKKAIIGVIMLLIIAGCQQKPKFPKETITPSKMAKIVVEIQLAEALITKMNLHNVDSSKVAFHYLEDKIMKKYAIDTATYKKSFETYARYPDQLKLIYEDAWKILNAKNDSISNAKKTPTKIK